MDQGGAMWGFALIGGPLLLFLALLWARMRGAKREDQVDHVRSKSDPSHGMTGAGVSPDTVVKDAKSERP